MYREPPGTYGDRDRWRSVVASRPDGGSANTQDESHTVCDDQTEGRGFVTTTGPRAGEAPAAAQAVDLKKVYGSGETEVTALAGVSADFPGGEFTAIMGPSGSGKSTLMHCLAGLDTFTSGEVYIGGE